MEQGSAIETFETLVERFGYKTAREMLVVLDGTAPPRLKTVEIELKRRRFPQLLQQYPDRRRMSLRRIAGLLQIDFHTARRWRDEVEGIDRNNDERGEHMAEGKRDITRCNWKGMVEEALTSLGGQAKASAIVAALKSKTPTTNNTLKATVSRVLQHHFYRVDRGVYSLTKPEATAVSQTAPVCPEDPQEAVATS